MKKFKSKKRVFEYITKKFKKDSKLILIRGSTANGSIKQFSDIDAETYGKLKKPYYEIIFVKNKPVLITVYFYKYQEGKRIKSPKNVKIVYGKYNNIIEKRFNERSHFAKDTYTAEQKITRECQLAIDFMFKYLRSKDKKALESVQKKIKWQ